MPMAHTAVVPFKPKPRAGDVDRRIAEAIASVKAVEDHDRHRKDLVSARAEAITRALEAGATLQELGERLGITAGRVRQLSRGE